jgi:hypothetical protein
MREEEKNGRIGILGCILLVCCLLWFFMLRGDMSSLVLMFFCDVCSKAFLVKTFHLNLVDYFGGYD